MISAYMRTFWEYSLRPALGGEMPLEPGMKRVRWTCVCERRYYDDFVEIEPGAVARIQALLHDVYRKKEIQAVPGRSNSVWLRMWNTIIVVARQYQMDFAWMVFTLKYQADLNLRIFTWVDFILIFLYCCVIILLLNSEWFYQNTIGLLLLAAWILSIMAAYIQWWYGAYRSVLRKLGISHDSSMVLPPDIGKLLPDWAEARYLGLIRGTQKSKKITHSVSNGKDGKASKRRGAGVSQPQGINFSEPGDLSIQRLPTANASDEDWSDQESNPPEVRTHGMPNTDERDANSGQALWVIPCFRNSKGDNQVVQVRVSDSTQDWALFSCFRQEYFRISSWWRRFVKMQEVTAIRFVMLGLIAGDKPEEYIADIRQTDVWPPKAEPQVWLYDPCPAVNIPLVGQSYLMKIWRESHHADRSTYEAWRQQAAWYYRAFDWTRHAFPRWVQKMLGDWGLDPNAEKIELENGVRPSDLNRAKFRQSIPARRSRYAIVAIPKKKGEKVEPDPGGVKREEVWGLQFEEGFTIHRLLFYLLVLYFLGNIVAVIHLFQEASGPVSMANKLWIFGWIASFVTLLLTVWLKWAETPK